METISNTVEDYLIDSLSFKLPLGSSYITNRSKSTFYASGSNIYKPLQGTKVVRFNLSGQDGTWLDPSTLRIQFDLKNDGAQTVRPLGGAHLFFRRARVLVGGAVAEDLQEYNRFHEMMDSLQPDNVRDNTDNHGFGYRWDDKQHKYPLNESTWDITSMPGVETGKKQTVCFKPFFGLLNQSKLLPIKYAPIVIELEIVNASEDAIITPGKLNPYLNATEQTRSVNFDTSNTGTSWSIENMCVKVDCVTLDNNLNNEYTAHLMSGSALPIKYSTYINQQSTIVGKPVAVQVQRAVSKMQNAYVTFYNTPEFETILDKPAIKFYHPMGEGNVDGKLKYDPSRELELQLCVGAKQFPEYPVRSISESFSMLKQTLNIPNFHMHSIGIDYKQYISNKFIFAVGMEKVPESSFTGLATKSGEIVIVKVSNADSSYFPANIATQMYITLQCENILEIRSVGVTVFD